MSDVYVIDLGDAIEETKQCSPAFFVPDSWFQWGSHQYPNPCDGPWG